MKRIFTCLIIVVISQFAISQESKDLEKLKTEIDSLFHSVEGDYAIAFKNISRENGSIFINAREDFHAASTMKISVMIEVYNQAEQGKFSLEDSLVVKNEFKSIVDGSSYSMDISRDSADKLYEQLGKKSSIIDLMIDMIIFSSNLATNNIIELVDAKNVNKTMRKLGAKDINVLRGVEDIKAYDAGLSNTTTAYDLMLIYEKLAKEEIVSSEASKKMIDILLQQQHNEVIPALLPENVKVAHKTGSITGVQHDSGIIFLPDGRKYVLVLLSKNMTNSEAGTKMLAEISKKVYNFMAAKEN